MYRISLGVCNANGKEDPNDAEMDNPLAHAVVAPCWGDCDEYTPRDRTRCYTSVDRAFCSIAQIADRALDLGVFVGDRPKK